MDASSFENIRTAVRGRNFKDEKLDALRSTLSCSYGYLSADQVAQLVPEFTFDDDKEKAVEICAPRMFSITCEQAASILRVFSFDKSKIKALEAIASHITDNNLSTLESAFSFPSDRNRAREILMNQHRAGPQPGLPSQPGAYPGLAPLPGGFPGMAPPQGSYPVPAPYPGSSPYPGQSPYPAGPYGGTCPPPGHNPYLPPGQAPPQYPTGTVPPPASQYPTGTVPPPAPYPGGPAVGVQGLLNAATDAMAKGISDAFGPPRHQGPHYPQQGGYYPPPGGYPPQGYPYPPPK